jgi:hypothetical protein
MSQDNTKDQRNKEALQRAIERNESEFEKKITYISAGALALSLTFIEKIIKIENSEYSTFLIAGWGALILSLSVNLCSFLISPKLTTITQDEYYDFMDGKSELSEDEILLNQKKRNSIISIINWITLGLLMLGIIFITTFCAINISNKAHTNRNIKNESIMSKTENASIKQSKTEQKGFTSNRLDRPSSQQQSSSSQSSSNSGSKKK